MTEPVEAASRHADKTYWRGTHRVLHPAETLHRLQPHLRALGVTRVGNVTGLDAIGIPVATAIRPNAWSLSVCQGKGLSIDAAKASAVMEAYEYACAEVPREDAVWARIAALDPATRVLPRQLARSRLRHQVELPWVTGVDLVSGRAVLVPEEVVSIDQRDPPRPGFGWFRRTSNGLASGNTIDEALLHALCELIERDSLTLWKLAPPHERAASRIDPRCCGDDAVHWLMDRYAAAAMRVEVWETTSDIGIPAFFCLIDDADGEPPFLGRFGGAGCHPDVGVALCRALTEAAQSRLTFIVGTRDDLPPDSYAVIGWERSIVNIIAGGRQADAEPSRTVSVSSVAGATIAADLAVVLGRLITRGIDTVIQVDLTMRSVGMACLRALVPQLEAPSHWPGYREGARARRMRCV